MSGDMRSFGLLAYAPPYLSCFGAHLAAYNSHAQSDGRPFALSHFTCAHTPAALPAAGPFCGDMASFFDCVLRSGLCLSPAVL